MLKELWLDCVAHELADCGLAYNFETSILYITKVSNSNPLRYEVKASFIDIPTDVQLNEYLTSIKKMSQADLVLLWNRLHPHLSLDDFGHG